MENFNLKLTPITPKVKNEKNLFFLGSWCLRNIPANDYKSFLIHKYHWDDRNKLIDDYNGLNSFIDNNFDTISKYMGKITNTSSDPRFWKINLGMWVGYLIQALFDRWENIRTLPNFKFNLIKTPLDINLLRPNTVDDFFTDLTTDGWNESVYRLIIQAQKKKINYQIDILRENPITFDRKKKKNKDKINSKINILLKHFINAINKLYKTNYFIIASYLSFFNSIKLNLFLKEIPIIYNNLNIFRPKINYKYLENKFEKSNNLNRISFEIDQKSPWMVRNKDFLIWFQDVISHFIPHNYFFHFEKFSKEMKSLPFPKKPKIIFTSNMYNRNDYFNLFASESVLLGAKYIIGQHGGTFRSAKINYSENIQKEVSDYYLTWGKDRHDDKQFRTKVIPVGNLKTSSRKIIKKKITNNRILLLTTDLPCYSNMLSSIPISGQFLNYYEDINKFLSKSKELGLYNQIIFRNKFRKDGWNFNKKILCQFPNISFDTINNYHKSIQSSSLIISTYNGATFLETLSLNIPTIFFWNPMYWELRDHSIKDYEELVEVGIFHKNPYSAAKFVHKINSNIYSWWNSTKVQTTRINFCIKYSKYNENISYDIMKIIKNAH